MRAAIYTRVSTEGQGERGYSLEAQLQDCRKLAAEMGADVVAQYQDIHSGASWDLPGLNTMLDAAKSTQFDTLIVYDPDRLARRLMKQMFILDDLKRHRVAVQYVTVKAGDTAEDRMMLNMRGVIAEYEREKIAFRTTRGRYQKAERGIVVGSGPPPYGYTYEYTAAREGDRPTVSGLVIDASKAEVVRRIFRELVTTQASEVADGLNRDTIHSPRGRFWGARSVLEISKNHAYYGTAVFGKRTKAERALRTLEPAAHWLTMDVPAILDYSDWLAAQEALGRRLRSHARTADSDDDPYELRGRVTCDHCGGLLSTRHNHGRRYYECNRHLPKLAAQQRVDVCRLPAVPAAALEALVWSAVSGALLDPELAARWLDSTDDRSEALDQRVASIERDIWNLRGRIRDISSQLIDVRRGSELAAAHMANADRAEAEIARLTRERTQLERERPHSLTGDTADALQRFADEFRDELESTSATGRRWIYQMLELRAITRQDDQGVALGRSHRFSVDLPALVPVRNSQSDQYSQKNCLA
jgi:site-specific DNA recombinase